MTPWRVIRCFVGDETDLGERLKQLGFETYAPAYTTRGKIRLGKKAEPEEVIRPLFPGYLFSRIEPDSRTDRLARSKYQLRVWYQQAIPDSVIEFVRATATEASRLIERRAIKLKPGDLAVIMQGVLRGEPVEILKVKKHKALVRLTRLGVNVIVGEVQFDNLGDVRATGVKTDSFTNQGHSDKRVIQVDVEAA